MIGIRLAKNEDGMEIARLLEASGFTIDGLDWSDVAPYWLVAEEENAIVGCVQIIVGKPVGWLELLSLEPNMGKKRKARTVKALVGHGAALLKSAGAQVVMGAVPDELASYIKVLENRGVRITAHGVVVAKRL